MKYFIQGLLLGISYVAPIGMQNLYVINSAMSNKKTDAYKIAFITIFFDISLAITCFWGIGTIIERLKVLKIFVLLVGCIVVIYIGLNLILSTTYINRKAAVEKNLTKTIASCFIVTWMNPQAIIDGSLLLGGFKASMSYENSGFFIFGSCTASFFWFIFLTTIVSIFKHSFNKKSIRIINIICGIVIIYYGLKLGLNFIQELSNTKFIDNLLNYIIVKGSEHIC
ncbi:LysE/ArgO family amino acid transporter [Clostridium sp. MT-14]|uniref:LysE family transporter n=1 Tax=Clostridium aromativorans TaxID=2836848 RepID=A0ABS8N624_9CLOT|nr:MULTISPECIES: LysE family transporter [Clostridium]KAA8680545.1 amino acid transporter [Clostridium sp. HV4-5-A1G]MCC9295271.1 LysE family transporter [Clostridium aromativorans]CAB1261850.1 Transporter, LysE family [Clostridiaceae bacterium BL-3]